MEFKEIIFRAISNMKKSSLVTILVVSFTFILIQDTYAIEVLRKGHYLKIFYSYFSNTAYFDNDREKQIFDNNGKGIFQKIILEYRYGISDRFNTGFSLPWISNAFKNTFSEMKRKSITDLSLIAEYRFLNLPSVLTLRGELKLPLNYKNNENQLYVGNGTTDILVAFIFKRFYNIPHKRQFSNLWFEIEAAISIPINNDPRNIDGDFSAPFRGSINYRPIQDLTFSGGFVGSINDDRDFLAVESFFKYRLITAIELEIGISYIFYGRNSSSGLNISVGLSVNTRRLWK